MVIVAKILSGCPPEIGDARGADVGGAGGGVGGDGGRGLRSKGGEGRLVILACGGTNNSCVADRLGVVVGVAICEWGVAGARAVEGA